MKRTSVIVRGLLCLAVCAMFVPALAQNANFDPHAHDWYNEQIKDKIDPATGEKLPTDGTNSQTQNAANNAIKKSLGAIDETYRGQHKFYADDFMGIWFDGLGHGDPTCWSILALLVMVGGGVCLKMRERPRPAADIKGTETASV